VTLDDLLRDVDDLLGRFGLDLRSPVERTLEALLDWARRFYAEVLAAWREEAGPQPDGSGTGPEAQAGPAKGSARPTGGRAAPAGGKAPRRPSVADVEAELARIKRDLRRKGDPDP
jgi:hypothetical protein